MRSVLSRLYLRFIVYSLGVHKGVYLLLGLALAFPGVSVRFPPALRRLSELKARLSILQRVRFPAVSRGRRSIFGPGRQLV